MESEDTLTKRSRQIDAAIRSLTQVRLPEMPCGIRVLKVLSRVLLGTCCWACVWRMLFGECYLLNAICCMFCCMLFVACCLVHVVWRMLLVECYLSHVVWCMFAWCMLYVDRCLQELRTLSGEYDPPPIATEY